MSTEAPFYVGTTSPGAVGWTRVGVNAACGIALTWLVATRIAPGALALTVIVGVVFAVLTALSWMKLSTRFIVDERGVTVSWGGFWPRPSWPLAQFRNVQLREVPEHLVGSTVGGIGWRTARVSPAQRADLTSVRARGVRTLAEPARYRVLVSRPGTMVEILGRDAVNYLLSPNDPAATAQAIDQAIRARR